MPNSLKCKIKHLCHNGTLTQSECERLLRALEQEPCEDCVSRDAVLDAMSDTWKHICFVARRKHPTKGEEAVYSDMCGTINRMPPVTPKQRTGKWIYEKRKRLVDETDEGAVYVTDYWCKCSKCGGDFGYRKMKDAFCKYCGAKMEGESE